MSTLTLTSPNPLKRTYDDADLNQSNDVPESRSAQPLATLDMHIQNEGARSTSTGGQALQTTDALRDHISSAFGTKKTKLTLEEKEARRKEKEAKAREKEEEKVKKEEEKKLKDVEKEEKRKAKEQQTRLKLEEKRIKEEEKDRKSRVCSHPTV